MKTLAFEKVNKKKTAILIVLFVAAFCTAFALSGRQAFAYEVSGQYSVNNSMTDVDEVPGGISSTTFHLYKVGHFEGEDPVFVLDDAYADVPVSIPLDYSRDDFASEDEWTRAWLDSAGTLANYLKEETIVAEITSAPDGSFSVSGIDNGLYLLMGDSQIIRDYPEKGMSSYWWPQPMYVKVLYGDVDISVKPQTELITKLQVIKTWQGDEAVRDKVRPDSVDVEIYYDGELRETVELGPSDDPEKNWSYECETSQGENDPSKWTCKEVLSGSDAENYSVTISESYSCDGENASAGDIKRFTLTNKYAGTEEENPPEEPDNEATTGDPFSPGKVLLLMALALIIGLAAVLKRRKDRD